MIKKILLFIIIMLTFSLMCCGVDSCSINDKINQNNFDENAIVSKEYENHDELSNEDENSSTNNEVAESCKIDSVFDILKIKEIHFNNIFSSSMYRTKDETFISAFNELIDTEYIDETKYNDLLYEKYRNKFNDNYTDYYMFSVFIDGLDDNYNLLFDITGSGFIIFHYNKIVDENEVVNLKTLVSTNPINLEKYNKLISVEYLKTINME